MISLCETLGEEKWRRKFSFKCMKWILIIFIINNNLYNNEYTYNNDNNNDNKWFTRLNNVLVHENVHLIIFN